MADLVDELVWGENIERRKHNHSLRGGCTNRNCGEYEEVEYIDFKKVIGVQKNDLPRPFMEYIAVLECSTCNIIYWFHIGKDSAKKIKSSKDE
ncbi:MAG: hypothetical protein AABW91_01060 [Nanoarchaeota archaeon]